MMNIVRCTGCGAEAQAWKGVSGNAHHCGGTFEPLPESSSADELPVRFLTIGGDRVYCVGCKQWVATEGYCEGDPDICPVGEEDQGRSPTLDDAQEAIESLAKELRELDEESASTIAVLQTDLDSAELELEQWRSAARVLDMSAGKSRILADLTEIARLEAVKEQPHWVVAPWRSRYHALDQHIRPACELFAALAAAREGATR